MVSSIRQGAEDHVLVVILLVVAAQVIRDAPDEIANFGMGWHKWSTALVFSEEVAGEVTAVVGLVERPVIAQTLRAQHEQRLSFKPGSIRKAGVVVLALGMVLSKAAFVL